MFLAGNHITNHWAVYDKLLLLKTSMSYHHREILQQCVWLVQNIVYCQSLFLSLWSAFIPLSCLCAADVFINSMKSSFISAFNPLVAEDWLLDLLRDFLFFLRLFLRCPAWTSSGLDLQWQKFVYHYTIELGSLEPRNHPTEFAYIKVELINMGNTWG